MRLWTIFQLDPRCTIIVSGWWLSDWLWAFILPTNSLKVSRIQVTPHRVIDSRQKPTDFVSESQEHVVLEIEWRAEMGTVFVPDWSSNISCRSLKIAKFCGGSISNQEQTPTAQSRRLQLKISAEFHCRSWAGLYPLQFLPLSLRPFLKPSMGSKVGNSVIFFCCVAVTGWWVFGSHSGSFRMYFLRACICPISNPDLGQNKHSR